MAKIFKSYQIKPDIWISSPAPRALETAQIFAKTLNYNNSKILQEDKLYTDNSAGAYMALIHTMRSDQKSVIFNLNIVKVFFLTDSNGALFY